MMRLFEITTLLLAIIALSPCSRAFAAGTSPEICFTRDDKKDIELLESFIVATLKEHERFAFTKAVKKWAREQSRGFYIQRIEDKRSDICSAHLNLADAIKAAAFRYNSGDCAAAATVQVFDNYFNFVSGIEEENRKILVKLAEAHLNELKLKFLEIVRGNYSIVGGVTIGGVPLASAPQSLRLQWMEQEITKLADEAKNVWGNRNPLGNPLIQFHALILQEAKKAKAERDAQRVRLHSDGRMPASCKPK